MTFKTDTKSIVIGGTSGIGKAVADALSSRPGTVVAASQTTASASGLECTYRRFTAPIS